MTTRSCRTRLRRSANREASRLQLLPRLRPTGRSLHILRCAMRGATQRLCLPQQGVVPSHLAVPLEEEREGRAGDRGRWLRLAAFPEMGLIHRAAPRVERGRAHREASRLLGRCGLWLALGLLSFCPLHCDQYLLGFAYVIVGSSSYYNV